MHLTQVIFTFRVYVRLTWQNLPESICEVQEEREASAPSSGSLTGRGEACLSQSWDEVFEAPASQASTRKKEQGQEKSPGDQMGAQAGPGPPVPMPVGEAATSCVPKESLGCVQAR